MKFLNIQNFIRGLFEKEGDEARIADEFLVKLYNVDIDETGKLKTRWGYKKWDDLTNSISSKLGLPDNKFNNSRIQQIYQYEDVGGRRYIIAVVDGKVYVETLNNNNEKQWSCLNPNFSFVNKVTHIDIVNYLDLLFFNDVKNNVYYYDSSVLSKEFGENITGINYIYFAGDTIYFRKYNDFSFDKSIKIENGNPSNFDGQFIYDSLVNIEYPYRDNLQLGFALRIGDEERGIYYYVLDNGKNQRGDNKCQIIKFNDKLMAQSYIELDMDANAEVLNFDWYKKGGWQTEKIYIRVKDNRIEQISTDTMINEPIRNGDITSLGMPVINGKKHYSVVVVDENHIFTYTNKIPDKRDWWQPAIINKTSNITDYWNYMSNDARKNGGKGSHFDYRYAYVNYIKSIYGHNYNKNFEILYKARRWHDGGYLHLGYFSEFKFFGGNLSNMRLNIVNIRKNIYDNDFIPFDYEQSGDTFYFFGYDYARDRYIDDWRRKIAIRWIVYGYQDETLMDHNVFKHHYKAIISSPNECNVPFKNIYLYYHPYFGYDENGNVLSKQLMYYLGCAENHYRYMYRNDNVSFYVIGNNYSNLWFNTDKTAKYLLLVAVDINGNMPYKTVSTLDEGQKKWRWLVPLGLINEVNKPVPIIKTGNNKIAVGTKMNGSDVGGKYIEINLDDYSLDIEQTNQSDYKSIIQGTDNFFMRDYNKSGFVVSNSWKIDVGSNNYDDYMNLEDFNSNLLYIVRKQAIGVEDIEDMDKLTKLGSAGMVKVSMDFNPNSDFVPGTHYKYQIAYQLNDGKVTPLSAESLEMIIPDLGEGNNVEIRVENIDVVDERGVILYDKDNVQNILLYRKERTDTTDWSEPYLIHIVDNANIGDPNHTYFIDTQKEYPKTLYLKANEIRYPVYDIFIHKNRLVLVNKTNEENSNIIQYSNVDMAKTIPAENLRDIESGDGDSLVAGLSVGDYAMFFKSRKIYAILGDVANGQMIDISKSVGTKYKNMIVEYNNVIYFLNDDGIYRVIPPHPPENLLSQRVGNYFDKQRDDSIDFDNLDEHGFAYVDVEKKEVKFYVVQKRDYEQYIKNNLCIVYNIPYDYFRIYEYYDNIFCEAYVKDILTGEYEDLIGNYEGDIFRLCKEKSDNYKEIKWIIRTKEFDVGTNLVDKIFKIIKLFGRFLVDIRITYWIDGKRYSGDIYNRDTIRDKGSAMVKIWSGGRAKRIMIEIEGKQLNYPPTEIEEILVGYDTARGITK